VETSKPYDPVHVGSLGVNGIVVQVEYLSDLIEEFWLLSFCRIRHITLLDKMTSRNLGGILRELGGSANEAKKPKGMLIDRILWRLFDFQAGHEILRAEKDSGQQAG
jgi:hypothetical protein